MCYIQWATTHPLKRWNPSICDNMEGPWGYYAEWNKSHGVRQVKYPTISLMWNIKQNKAKQTMNK